jgi:hypothetical protein
MQGRWRSFYWANPESIFGGFIRLMVGRESEMCEVGE